MAGRTVATPLLTAGDALSGPGADITIAHFGDASLLIGTSRVSGSHRKHKHCTRASRAAASRSRQQAAGIRILCSERDCARGGVCVHCEDGRGDAS